MFSENLRCPWKYAQNSRQILTETPLAAAAADHQLHWLVPAPKIFFQIKPRIEKWWEMIGKKLSWWSFFAKNIRNNVIFFNKTRYFWYMTIMHSLKDSKYLILIRSFLHLLEWMGHCRQWAGGNHREGLVTAVKHHELHDQTIPEKMKSTEKSHKNGKSWYELARICIETEVVGKIPAKKRKNTRTQCMLPTVTVRRIQM